jgi:DNA polymerase-3 subunit epsilon
MLDWAMADGSLSREEKQTVEAARAVLGIDARQVIELHRAYLCSIEAAIRRDGRVTKEEAVLFSRISKMLGLGHATIEVTENAAVEPSLRPGCRVCFTGSAIDAMGKPIKRAELEQLAARSGLQPISNVTKKACDLLVAEDPESLSGKAVTARKFGIPVISVTEFLRRVGR